MGNKNYRNSSKVYKRHRRPFDTATMDFESKVCGEFGLGPKKEILVANHILMQLRRRARYLMNLQIDDPERVVYEPLIVRKCKKLGLLANDQNELDYILALKTEDLLERRLQTMVFRKALAPSIHAARAMIVGGHICVDGRKVDKPGFLVRKENEFRIDLNPRSAMVPGNRPGRSKKKKVRGEREAQ